MRHDLDIKGPPRSFFKPALAVAAVAGILFLGWSFYLRTLEPQCRERCLASGAKGYRYIEPTGSGRHFERGRCECVP